MRALFSFSTHNKFPHDPMSIEHPPLRWLEPGDAFPSTDGAWGADSEAPGLLIAGGDLSVDTLLRAYGNGIFPWFSEGQPILWWSPDPRMVLSTPNFRLHRSLRQALNRFICNSHCEIRFDTAFRDVIGACAGKLRHGQPGTWILPPMVDAYCKLHHAGHAHSVETWVEGKLVGGLYCVAIGKAVFGESMFTHIPDASKIALAALIAFCREHAIATVDCQQNTAHLASLGAQEIPRNVFLEHIERAQLSQPAKWYFSPLYWNHILSA
jgi:leucyl/phenylalanyl-tRNA--protein transferase